MRDSRTLLEIHQQPARVFQRQLDLDDRHLPSPLPLSVPARADNRTGESLYLGHPQFEGFEVIRSERKAAAA